MPRWIGLMGSWALLVLGLSLTGVAVAGELINVRDARRIRRAERVEQLIAERVEPKLTRLESAVERSQTQIGALQSKATRLEDTIDDFADTDQTVLVSTGANRVELKRGPTTVFSAVCSTGSGEKLEANGRTLVFRTPIGRFRIISKEENPVWVPPDWHFIEEGRKKGKRVLTLERGRRLPLGGGASEKSENGEGFFGWFGERPAPASRYLEVRGDTIVEVNGGQSRELPAGEVITYGDAVVVPPLGTKQRKFDKVLGSYRLNLGDGYALHGTLAVGQLGRSVSHGCVRLADPDIQKLYAMTKVGDEVIIY